MTRVVRVCRRRLRLLLMNATEGMDSSVLSIWLGVCMDGLPEAVLIGLLAMQRRMSVPFIASVFVANFPVRSRHHPLRLVYARSSVPCRAEIRCVHRGPRISFLTLP
jgi:hypothetical protein